MIIEGIFEAEGRFDIKQMGTVFVIKSNRVGEFFLGASINISYKGYTKAYIIQALDHFRQRCFDPEAVNCVGYSYCFAIFCMSCSC